MEPGRNEEGALESPHDAVAALQAIEQAAQFVASDTAQLLGSLQGSLQSVNEGCPTRAAALLDV